jgi:glycosyltransferase involved in cell wall biosynthesis
MPTSSTGDIGSKSPLVSVIIVVFNAERFLKHAVESVLGQTYQRVEIVVIDGGSSDKTMEVVQSFGSRIAFSSSEKDNGIYDAMNKGIKAAAGEWLLFLGADDVFYSNGTLANIFTGNYPAGVDFLYGDVEFLSNKKRFGGEKNLRSIIDRNLCHQGIFYKKDVFIKLGLYDCRYPIAADHEMNIRIFRDNALSKKRLSGIVSIFNDKGASNNIIDRHFHSDMLKIFLEEDQMPFFSPELQQYHFHYGLMGLLHGDYRSALKYIPSSWIKGNRKLFYFFYTGKFILKILFRIKIKLKAGYKNQTAYTGYNA